MRTYEFSRARDIDAATRDTVEGTVFLAGGTTLVDLMKLEVLTPRRVVDITALPLTGISADAVGLRIGALETMTAVAENPVVRQDYTLISQALELSASAQLRNMARMGGNLLQRTRCSYFRDVSMPCNKRVPGSGCPAITGHNRMHAVLGTSADCVATHASDVAVALVAARASVTLDGPGGQRTMALEQFYRRPGGTPDVETELGPGELITAIEVPRLPRGIRSGYLKIRDRQSYEFALTSVAAAVAVGAGGVITDARLAAGGVATVPWRLPEVESALVGRTAGAAVFDAAAAAAANDAQTLPHNGFKPQLLRRAIVRALTDLMGVA